LNRRVNIQTVSEDNPRLSTSEQLSGIAPNFIHSLDASHMLLTINAMWDDGIQDFNMIHDSFGCHASDVTRMHKHIREQFVWMYTTFNPALDLARSAAEQTGEEIIFPPEGGNLDISKVLEAPYFFA
jgi:DNA-directed RNA polymerase